MKRVVGTIALIVAGAVVLVVAATGRGEGGTSRDYCEVNGTEGTLVYLLERPNEIQLGKRGDRK